MKRDEQNERFELSALDPFSDSAHADVFVRDVLARSEFELARRRRAAAAGELTWGGGTVLSIVAGWARPALAAAIAAVAISVVALRSAASEAEANAGVIEALALPGPVETWLVEERAPATADLIMTLEGGSPW